jgi:hypothetical protein
MNASDIPNSDNQIKLQHKRRERTQQVVTKNREDPQTCHIPTLLNGKTENKSLKIVSSEVTYKNHVIKNKFRQHKVTMIGDSFVSGIKENVELSLSNKFSTYSVVKPGCELKTLLNQQIVLQEA